MKIRVHGDSLTCWCDPAVLHCFTDGRRVLMHRLPDGRWPGAFEQIMAIVLEAFGDGRDVGDVLLEWDMEARPDAYA